MDYSMRPDPRVDLLVLDRSSSAAPARQERVYGTSSRPGTAASQGGASQGGGSRPGTAASQGGASQSGERQAIAGYAHAPRPRSAEGGRPSSAGSSRPRTAESGAPSQHHKLVSDLYGHRVLPLSTAQKVVGLGAPSVGGEMPPGMVGDAITHEARLRLAFEAIDIDASRTVGKRELYDALRRVGVDGSSHQMLQLYKEAHRDRTSQEALTWPEFRALGFKLTSLALLGAGRPAEQLVADQLKEATRPRSAARAEEGFLARQDAAHKSLAAKRAVAEKALAKPPKSHPPGNIPALRPPEARVQPIATGWAA